MKIEYRDASSAALSSVPLPMLLRYLGDLFVALRCLVVICFSSVRDYFGVQG